MSLVFGSSKWSVCVDAAALVSTSPLDLSLYCPDFVVFSFYKIFGYPTALGALLIRNSAKESFGNRKRFFGGGSVAFASPFDVTVKMRERIEERLAHNIINKIESIYFHF